MTPSQRERLFALYFILCVRRRVPESCIGKEARNSSGDVLIVDYARPSKLHRKVVNVLIACGLSDVEEYPVSRHRIFQLSPSARSGVFKHSVTLGSLIKAKRFMHSRTFKRAYTYFFNVLKHGDGVL